jgi:hypothetical protein
MVAITAISRPTAPQPDWTASEIVAHIPILRIGAIGAVLFFLDPIDVRLLRMRLVVCVIK